MDTTNLWQERNFKRWATMAAFLLVLLLLLAIISGVKEYRFIGGGVPVSNVITVTGEGEIFAVPDIANFSFSVVQESATASEAQSQSAEKINAILAYLDDQGIEEKDIKTSSYNVYPRYDFIQLPCTEFRCPPGQQELRGFETNQTITVKVRSTDRAGEIISGVGELGATNVSGLNFTIEDEDVLNTQAREMAIDDARQKAKELSKQLGVSLKRVVSFSESGFQPYYARSFGGDTAFFEESVAVAPQIPTGENRIVSNVTITYEIR